MEYFTHYVLGLTDYIKPFCYILCRSDCCLADVPRYSNDPEGAGQLYSTSALPT